jgi:hypothetical protein
MAQAPTRRAAIGPRTAVAYAIGFALAAAAILLGITFPSVPWFAVGIWLAASLAVLLLDRAAGQQTPRPSRSGEESLGAIFQGSPAALTVIAVMAVAALVVALFARW